MDIFVAALLALVTAGGNGIGLALALKDDWSDRSRKRFAAVFVVLLIVGVGLVVWQAVLAHQGGEESKKAQLGDSEHPPHIGIISLPHRTQFVRTNASDYPAYSVQIKLYDENGQLMRSYGPDEMAAHTAIVDEKDPWNVNDNLEHRFTAQITSRTGITREELFLRPAGNNQWMMACRTDGEALKCQQPDSYWPRDQKGQPIF